MTAAPSHRHVGAYAGFGPRTSRSSSRTAVHVWRLVPDIAPALRSNPSSKSTTVLSYGVNRVASSERQGRPTSCTPGALHSTGPVLSGVLRFAWARHHRLTANRHGIVDPTSQGWPASAALPEGPGSLVADEVGKLSHSIKCLRPKTMAATNLITGPAPRAINLSRITETTWEEAKMTQSTGVNRIFVKRERRRREPTRRR